MLILLEKKSAVEELLIISTCKGFLSEMWTGLSLCVYTASLSHVISIFLFPTHTQLSDTAFPLCIIFSCASTMRSNIFPSSYSPSLSATPLSASLPHDSLSDHHALLAFKHSLSLPSLPLWTPNNPFCNWTGVTCSKRTHRVVSLNVTGMSLHGPLSPFLGNLSFLRVLALWNNTFQGPIPYELGRLSRLRILRLSKNELEGSIPATLGRCRNLQHLILSYNKLSGNIPAQLGLLSNLEIMALEVNQLTGQIPSFIGNMYSLTLLGLAENSLHGPIPSFVGNMSSLIELTLYENSLHGPIPAQLGLLSNLEIRALEGNQLTGQIPSFIGNMSSLTDLELAENSLHGPIPLELGMLSQLQLLYLHDNTLTGEIPTSLSNCTQLVELSLVDNRLRGTVPMEFGKLLHLQTLLLNHNQLVSGGSSLLILTALTNCSLLKVLLMDNNYFSGFLRSSVGQLSSSLYSLSLTSNQLEGNIPVEIGNLTNLNQVFLDDNRFTGTIPTCLGGLQNLERLYLGGNHLHGKIPKNLDQLKRLGLLSLSNNMLSGQIPDTLANLPQLRELLDGNQLSGQIPAKLSRCITLEVVDLAYNKLSGHIPPEVAGLPNLQFYFNASNNLLEGFLPFKIGKMVMVQAIDVSVNQLSGGIPSTLVGCTNLQFLNLSRNAFQGPIPHSLADVKNLQDLDLSCNNLSGTIPVAFRNMTELKHLNLSSNKLIGEVPNGGIFTALDASAFTGNPGLCGSWIHLPACSASKNQRSMILKIVIIIVVIAGTVFLMSLLLFLRSYWKRNSKGLNAFALKFGLPRISYEDILDATQGFNETNMIGSGRFGSVYKGTLNNGRDVAIKVLNLQDEEAHQSFQRECNALRRARHRNVIKIITSCCNLDFKALVLPFMSNGNLYRWLNSHGEDAFKLNLAERLRIAMEIAQGMAYLHHHSSVQIVHCDLKPTNVLLGDDMTAYIADFGIARLIFGGSFDLTSTNAFQGSIGYVAPEYGLGGNISSKGDVYSYGIVLLELLTSKKPTDDMFEGGMNLPKWVNMEFPNRVREVVDNFLLQDVNESNTTTMLTSISQLMQVGLACANERPHERPNMMEVVDRLEKIKDIFLGIPRAFQLPIDISLLINNTNAATSVNVENNQSWSTSSS